MVSPLTAPSTYALIFPFTYTSATSISFPRYSDTFTFTSGQKIAQHNQEYYEASNEATQLLREIDRILHAAYANGSGSFYTASEELLTGLGGISMDFSLEQPTIAYEVSINDTQALKVILTLNRPDQTASGYYKISTWQEIPSTTWEGDDSLNLMNYQ